MPELPLPLYDEDKIRLLMVYVITQDGIKSEERRQLMTLAGTWVGPALATAAHGAGRHPAGDPRHHAYRYCP